MASGTLTPNEPNDEESRRSKASRDADQSVSMRRNEDAMESKCRDQNRSIHSGPYFLPLPYLCGGRSYTTSSC